MKIPQLYENNPSLRFTEEFRGYNRTERPADGEFYDMNNLSTLAYPVLSLRPKRFFYEKSLTSPIADARCLRIVGGHVYYLAKAGAADVGAEDFEYRLYKDFEEIPLTDGSPPDLLSDVDAWAFNGTEICVVNGAEIYYFSKTLDSDQRIYGAVKYNTITGKFRSLQSQVGSLNLKMEPVVSDGLKFKPLYKPLHIGFALPPDGLNDDDGLGIILNFFKNNESFFNPVFNKNRRYTAHYYNDDGVKLNRGFMAVFDDSSGAPAVSADQIDGTKAFIDGDESPLDQEKQYFLYDLITKTLIDENGEKFSPFVKISGGGISKAFSQYSAVKQYNEQGIMDNGTAAATVDLPSGMTVYECGADEDYIIVNGFISVDDGMSGADCGLLFGRDIPYMDYAVEHNNRLYGCRFGAQPFNADPKDPDRVVNEIYISALGDPGNFSIVNGYENTAFISTVGVMGEFTGACEYQGAVYFFKDNSVVRVSGYAPSTFSVETIAVHGVADGASDSLAESDGYLYYYSRAGVMRFNGQYAAKISGRFGGSGYGGFASGCVADGRYYLSITGGEMVNAAQKARAQAAREADEKGLTGFQRTFYIELRVAAILASLIPGGLSNAVMFVLDLNTGFWEKYELPYAACMYSDMTQPYIIDAAGRFYTLSTRDETEVPAGTVYSDFKFEDALDWYGETGWYGYGEAPDKYIGKMLIRAETPIGSSFNVLIKYDNDADFKILYSVEGMGERSYVLPITPHRCDRFKLRLEGTGDVKIYSISKQIETGSEIN